MSNVTSAVKKSNAEYEAIADQLLADMRHIEEVMQQDRSEIERLKVETARLEAENRVVLDRLKAMW